MPSRFTAGCIALLLVLVPQRALGQATVPAKGSGDVTVTWQEVTNHLHLASTGATVDVGHITAKSLQLRLDYGLTDHLALSLAAPFVSKKYIGPDPHDPGSIEGGEHAHDATIDDGTFHSSWQDYSVGLRRQWKSGPWLLTPFATYSWPSHDYVFFAHAAVGTHQKKLALGLAAARRFGPRLPRLYAQGTYTYTFVERVLDVPLDYSTANAEVGWFFSPHFSARAFAGYRRTHGGLDAEVLLSQPTTERFFHHDQLLRTNYLTAGVGATWRANERWSVSGNWMTTVWGINGHAIHNAVSVGVTRSF